MNFSDLLYKKTAFSVIVFVNYAGEAHIIPAKNAGYIALFPAKNEITQAFLTPYFNYLIIW